VVGSASFTKAPSASAVPFTTSNSALLFFTTYWLDAACVTNCENFRPVGTAESSGVRNALAVLSALGGGHAGGRRTRMRVNGA
jgi:hypothetical protein